MRLGVFGGTFDPPHLGHLVVAEYARESLRLDTIIFIPAGKNPLKESHTQSSADDRLAMTRLAIAGNPAFELSEIELHRTGPSYTIDTIRELRATRTLDELVLIVGHDNLEQFPRWHNVEALVRECRVVVCKRTTEGEPIDERLREAVEELDSPIIELSSTMLRERVARGERIRYMVPDAVIEYIDAHALYR
jgi:nicotinate-nucleotide adenylyltransferase